MSRILAAALGGAAGAVALVGIIFIIIRSYCLSRNRSASRSETSSSEPSFHVGRNTASMNEDISYPSNLQGARCFALEELNLATRSFRDINLIGHGQFGEVYKGLLSDGMIVAIKRRLAAASREFIQEVRHLASIRHRNLVSLLGYCQDNDLQMLVYEYAPNGSVSSHLHGVSKKSSEKLEFKQRLLIALGAAKGLGHLHAFEPPILHMNFKTANVLVDEGFMSKVADAGLTNLLNRVDGASSSSQMIEDNPFIDPEAKESGIFTMKSDVYSFGVFLLELVSGREARSDQTIIEQAQNYHESMDISSMVDNRMGSSFTTEVMKELLRLIFWCMNPEGERRPPMSFVVLEINRIHEKEMSLTTIMGEGETPTVTLGSQLFRAA